MLDGGLAYRLGLFANREELFEVLARQASAAMIALLERLPADGAPERLRSWLDEWFDTYLHHGAVVSAWEEIERTDPGSGALSRQVFVDAHDLLVDLLGRRGLGGVSVDAIAFLALIERLPYSVHTLGHTAREQAVEAMVVIIRRGLMGI